MCSSLTETFFSESGNFYLKMPSLMGTCGRKPPSTDWDGSGNDDVKEASHPTAQEEDGQVV